MIPELAPKEKSLPSYVNILLPEELLAELFNKEILKPLGTRGGQLLASFIGERDIVTDNFYANVFRFKEANDREPTKAEKIKIQQLTDQVKSLNEELKVALETTEKAKEAALNDLDLLQKKTQTELIESIVRVSLWIVSGVGVVTTLMFALSLILGVDNKIIESAWSNMFGILLTNSFSIIGTIMGVKYASENKGSKSKRKKDCDCNCNDE